MWYLTTLLPDESPPKEIAGSIRMIIEAEEADVSLRDWSAGPRLIEDIENHRPSFEAYLGDRFSEFEFVVRSIAQAHESYSAYEADGEAGFYKTRDRYMYENFLHQYERLPKAKYYGHFGYAHVYNKPGLLWLGSHLNGSGSPVEGKVLSTVFTYYDCYANQYGSGRSNVPYETERLPYDLTLRPRVSATLYKVVGPGSPFEARPLLYLKGMTDLQCPTADYFQFLVVIRGSPASRTYEQKPEGP